LNTSYFAISGKHENAVAVCGRPWFYTGRVYEKLAPKSWFLKKYKKDGDEDFYTKQYYAEVLDKLDPKEVYEELGEDAILVCWEGRDKFCHRHIIADWLSKHLGVIIEEL
jgi:hypothetical protein